MKKIIPCIFGLLSLFFITNTVHGAIIINEIMYDLDGSDTGREWIEVYNSGSEEVDLSKYKFFESGTNHGLVFDSGASVLAPSSYAVIVSEPVKFKSDWPSFSGVIFDSSFSLDNIGETLAIKNANLETEDEYTYSSDTGAAGDLKSLQKISGSWVASMPTPGVINVPQGDSSQNNNTPSNSSTNITAPSNSASVISSKVADKKITVEIVTSTLAFTGLAFELNARLNGPDGTPISGKLYWNFGDGTTKEVRLPYVEAFSHTYYYAGDYRLSLEYYSNDYEKTPLASDEILVKVTPATIVISQVGNEADFFVELKNTSSYSIDLAGWQLRAGDKRFTLPKNSVILAGKTMILGSHVTGFTYTSKEDLHLFSPAGHLVFAFNLPNSTPGTASKRVSSISKTTLALASTADRAPIGVSGEIDLSSNSESFLSENLTSNAISNKTEQTSNSFMVFFGLFLIIVLGVGSVYFLRQKKEEKVAEEDFEILEN